MTGRTYGTHNCIAEKLFLKGSTMNRINQTGNGDPPPKQPRRQPVEPVSTTPPKK